MILKIRVFESHWNKCSVYPWKPKFECHMSQNIESKYAVWRVLKIIMQPFLKILNFSI